MPRPVHRWVDHTSEVQLEIEAPDEEGVLAEAAAALAGLVSAELEEPLGGPRTTRRVTVTEPDRPALLAAWIEELAFLSETEGFLADEVDSMELTSGGVQAQVSGRTGTLPHLVKAVTYHRLTFQATEGGYRARVILDV